MPDRDTRSAPGNARRKSRMSGSPSGHGHDGSARTPAGQSLAGESWQRAAKRTVSSGRGGDMPAPAPSWCGCRCRSPGAIWQGRHTEQGIELGEERLECAAFTQHLEEDLGCRPQQHFQLLPDPLRGQGGPARQPPVISLISPSVSRGHHEPWAWKRAAKRATRRMRRGSSAKAGETWRSSRASRSCTPP